MAGLTLAAALGLAASRAGDARAGTDVPAPHLTALAVQLIEPSRPAIVVGQLGRHARRGTGIDLPDRGTAVVAAGWTTRPAHRGGAVVTVRGGSLLRGAIAFATASAHSGTGRDPAKPAPRATWTVEGLVVLGRAVTPVAGRTIKLGRWGSLTIGSAERLAEPAGSGSGVSAAALTVTLTRARDHLPAGTRIVVAQASASVTPPPTTPPPSPPSPPSPPQPPAPPPARHPTHRPSHRHPQPRHPHVRPRPVHRRLLTHPRTLPVSLRLRIVAWAESQIGWPYVWGGTNEREGGFDCSGLVDFAYASAGAPLPGRPTAEVLWRMAQPIARARLLPGDLVFLLTRGGYAYHVGIYAGHGQVIVAPFQGSHVQRQELGQTPWQAFGRLWLPGLRAGRRPPPLALTPPVGRAWRVEAAAAGSAPAHREAGRTVWGRPDHDRRGRRLPHAGWLLGPVWAEPARAMVLPVPVPLTPGVWA